MGKKFYKVLVPVYALICLASVVGIVYSADLYPVLPDEKAQYFMSAALVATGVLSGSVVHALVHETGHVIPLLLNKAEIVEFSVLGLRVQTLYGKRKVGFSLKSGYSGYVSFVMKQYENSQIVAYNSAIGAGIGSLLTIMLLAPVFHFVHNYYVYCIVGGAYIATLYSVLVNYLSLMPTSDGELIFFAEKSYEIYHAIREVESRLYYGERLSEMPDELFSDEKSYLNGYYSLLRSLEKGDLAEAEKLLPKLREENEKYFINQPITLDLQEFFISVTKGDASAVEKLKDRVLDFCDREINPTSLRVQIAYRKSVNDTEWTEALEKTFTAQENNSFKGLFLTEKAILEYFSAGA